jgi:hypothetical protein
MIVFRTINSAELFRGVALQSPYSPAATISAWTALVLTFLASSRMTSASAEEKIDEPTGKFLRQCSDVAYFELLAYLRRANWISAAIVRQSANFDCGGDGHLAEPATVSGLSEWDCGHWVPHRAESIVLDEFQN